MILTVIFFIVLGYLVILEEFSVIVLYYFSVINVITFMVYAWDKSAARRGKWRVKENTLHILSLTGGWCGAIIAQQKLRHKTVKKPFKWIYWLTVALNISALVWYVFSDIGAYLQSLFHR